MLDEHVKKDLYKSKEVKALKKILPNVFMYFDGNDSLLDELFYIDIETFLYINLLNIDKDLFKEKVNKMAEEYDIVETSYDNENLKIYPRFLLKYIYINMKKLEKENNK